MSAILLGSSGHILDAPGQSAIHILGATYKVLRKLGHTVSAVDVHAVENHTHFSM